MSWWQRLCIATAVSFFASLKDASPEIRAKTKPIALEIFNYIRIAFYGDGDFE